MAGAGAHADGAGRGGLWGARRDPLGVSPTTHRVRSSLDPGLRLAPPTPSAPRVDADPRADRPARGAAAGRRGGRGPNRRARPRTTGAERRGVRRGGLGGLAALVSTRSSAGTCSRTSWASQVGSAPPARLRARPTADLGVRFADGERWPAPRSPRPAASGRAARGAGFEASTRQRWSTRRSRGPSRRPRGPPGGRPLPPRRPTRPGPPYARSAGGQAPAGGCATSSP